MALGARAVLIGRPWAWVVAAHGEPGVRQLLEGLKKDIDTALGLTGHTSVADVDASALYDPGSGFLELMPRPDRPTGIRSPFSERGFRQMRGPIRLASTHV